MHSFRREVQPWVPCRRFAACKRSLNWRGSRNLRQNFWLILAHIIPPFATRISCIVWASVGQCGNVQTREANRVSTISLLDCDTTVALTMGPTDEEEEGLTQANIQQGSGNLSRSYSIQGVKLTVLLCIVPSYHSCSFCNGKLGNVLILL